MATKPDLAKRHIHGWLACAAALLALAVCRAAAGAGGDPERVEVKDKTAFLAYIDGNREQRDVQEGDRFPVVRRTGSYYVVRDGTRQALISIASVVPVKTPAQPSKWEFVVTKAFALVRIVHGGVPLLGASQAVFVRCDVHCFCEAVAHCRWPPWPWILRPTAGFWRLRASPARAGPMPQAANWR
jgi:hypothetical protein